MRLILLLLLCAFTVLVDSLTDPSVPDILYPFGTDVGDSIVPDRDSVSSPALDISTGFPFMFTNYSTVYVSIKACSLI